jgi:hypothetical protein
MPIVLFITLCRDCLISRARAKRVAVAKWRKWTFVHDASMDPKTARSTVLTAEEDGNI